MNPLSPLNFASTTIVSLGGSLVAPAQVAVEFIRQFRDLVRTWLSEDPSRRIVLIVGGGAPARQYQDALKALEQHPAAEAQDWIGIMATRLNAQLVKAAFGSDCPNDVVTDPTAPLEWKSRVLVAAGWKPGFSTDFDAVVLAERFQAGTVVNLSNIAQVYTDDPKKNPDARPLEKATWKEFRAIVGDEWVPGKNTPFDPIATRQAAQLGLRVCVASGSDLKNLGKILRNQPFFGTVIQP